MTFLKKKMTKFVLGFVIVIFFKCCLAKKQLNMLLVTGMTGWEFMGYRTCMNTIKFVMENSSHQYLPGYNINIVVKDEGANSLLAAQQLTQFWRDFNGQGSLAPIAFGPMSSMGCKPFAKILKQVNMYGVGMGCSSPAISADKDTYGHVIRVGTPGENIANAKIKYIKEHGWNHFAIFSTTIDLDFDESILIYKAAPKANISVDWFEALQPSTINSENGYKVLSRLKSTRNRIIVLGTTMTFDLIDFYCMAYKVGIRGPNYVFISNAYSQTFVDEMPDQLLMRFCDRKILKEQQSITFFVGESNPNLFNNFDRESSIGHTMKSFDIALDQYVNQATNWSSVDKEIDFYMRFDCYDVAMVALLLMNKTETSLNKNWMNLSLSDWDTHSHLVASEIARNVKGMQFDGFHNQNQMFSQRMEMDSRPVYVNSWNKGQMEFNFKVKPGIDIFDPNGYFLEQQTPVKWANGNKWPVEDLAKIIHEMRQIPIALTFSIVAIASLLTISQFILIVFLMVVKRAHLKDGTVRKVAVGLACIGLNGSAVIFAFGTVNEVGDDISINLIICKIRIILLAISITLLHGLSLLNLKVLVDKSKTPPSNGSRKRRVAFVTRINERRNRQRRGKGFEEMDLKIIFLIVSTTSLYLLIWLTSDQLTFTMVDEAPVVDQVADVTIIKADGVCSSENFSIWTTILIASNGCLLLVSIFFIIQLRSVANNDRFQSQNPGFKQIRALHFNYLVILIVTILFLFIFPTFSFQMAIIACVCIFNSLTTWILTGWKCY